MRPISSATQMSWTLSAALLISTIVAAPAKSADWASRLTPRVQNVWKAAQSAGSNTSQSTAVDSTAAASQASSSARYDSAGRIQVDVEFDCSQAAPTGALTSAGMIIGTTVKAPPMCVVEGWIAVASVPSLAAIPGVKKLDLPSYSRPHPPFSPRSQLGANGVSIAMSTNGTPAIDGNGIAIMNVDKYVQQTGVSGAGVTIGVISDDATSLGLIQSRGELPVPLSVIQPSANPMTHSSLTDEGTMMLEEVYAVAPGATLTFCGPETAVEYFGCVQNLIAAGATIVSDDLTYGGFDVMSAPSSNAAGQALQGVLTANPNVMLFHSVGNDAKDYWQGAYNPLNVPGGGTCSPPGQTSQSDNYFQQFGGNTHLTWQTNGGKDLLLASVLPTGQSVPSNFDVYIYNPVSAQVVTCSTSATGGTDGSTSYSMIPGGQIPQGNYSILIGTPDATLSGTFLKLIGNDDGGGTFSPVSPGAPSSPQDFATAVTTVGAVYGNDGIGNTIEPFSDIGPIQLEVPSASIAIAPTIVAPDAVYVDNSGTKFVASGGIFGGTSAASPNAASVAALLRSAFPTLTPTQVTDYIEAGATQLGTLPWNATFGYGRVDALGALAQIPAPTISGLQGTTIVGGTSSQPLPFTIGGTGTLKVTVTAPIFNAVVAPANCGSSPGTCTLTLTPALGALGTATVQVTVTDGANRSSFMQAPITLTAPPPPAVSVTSNATQSVIVSSAIAPIGFSLAGTGLTAVSVAESGISGFNVTSGCGTTTSTCTVNLGTAGTTTGTALVTLTVRDSYAQVTSASATVIVLPPAAPTISITGGGSQNVIVNGAIAPVTFTLTGMAPLTVTPNTSDISGVTISTGCGTTTMSCTANLGSAEGTPGTATLTLKVEDNYVQSASATATITESAAPGKGGGGAIDPWALLGLTSLVLVHKRLARGRMRESTER